MSAERGGRERRGLHGFAHTPPPRSLSISLNSAPHTPRGTGEKNTRKNTRTHTHTHTRARARAWKKGRDAPTEREGPSSIPFRGASPLTHWAARQKKRGEKQERKEKTLAQAPVPPQRGCQAEEAVDARLGGRRGRRRAADPAPAERAGDGAVCEVAGQRADGGREGGRLAVQELRERGRVDGRVCVCVCVRERERGGVWRRVERGARLS